MLPYIENAKTAMNLISEEIVEKLRKAKECGESGDAMSVTDYKKCMDIVRDITDSGIKLAKNEEVLEDQKEMDCLDVEKKAQEVYAMLQELKTHFTPKVLRDIIEMGEEKAIKIITQVVEKVMQEQDGKIKRRDYKTKEEYKRAKYIQSLVVKRSQEEIEKSEREYRAWFEEMSDPTPIEQRPFESLTEFSKNILRERQAEKQRAERESKQETQKAVENILNEDCMNWNGHQNSFTESKIDDGEIPSFYS